MKGKFWGVLVVAAALVWSAEVIAAPIGNPAKDIKKTEEPLSIGYEGGFVFNRDLDDDTELESHSHAARLGYVLGNLAEVYAVAGVFDLENSGTVSGTKVVLDTDTAFIWGVGGTLPLVEFDNGARVGLTGKYRRAKPDLDKITVGGASASVTDSDFKYQDWVLALGAGYPTDFGTPYFGVKYSDVALSDLTVSGTTFDADSNSDEKIGVFVGLDFEATDSLFINVEGRFIDETALSVNAGFKF